MLKERLTYGVRRSAGMHVRLAPHVILLESALLWCSLDSSRTFPHRFHHRFDIFQWWVNQVRYLDERTLMSPRGSE
jgi:hypothetical protein